MRTSTLFQLSAMALLTTAQPGLHRRHEQLHNKKRDLAMATATVDVMVDVNVYVYEDQDGNLISAETVTSVDGTSTEAPLAAPAVTYVPSNQVWPITHTHQLTQPTPVPAPASAAPASAAPVLVASSAPAPSNPSPVSNSGINFGGMGVSYDVFGGPQTVGIAPCRDILNEVKYMASIFSVIRIYDVSICNALADTLEGISAAGTSTRVMVSIDDPSTVSTDLANLISSASGKWSMIHSVIVGNEWNSGQGMAVSQIASTVASAKSTLRSAGYTGPVSSSEITSVFTNPANSALIEACDFIAANIYAYYDSTCTAADAGQIVVDQVTQISSVSGDKQVVVTESGWPSQGVAIGSAVASPGAQAAALASLVAAFKNNIVIFQAYDASYKNTDTVSEHYYGILPAYAGLF